MNFARFFRNVQDAPWYAHFLQPVLDAVHRLPEGSKVLDIGTGAGKLIEMGLEQPGLVWAGGDIDEAMLEEARGRAALHDVPLYQLSNDGHLPFADSTFDAVTLCSVLFLLPDPEPLLKEVWRVLRPSGQVIVLTPSGSGSITQSLIREIGLLPENWTFLLWRQMTASSGQTWAKTKRLAAYARQIGAQYSEQTAFQGLAVVETLRRPVV